MSTAPQQDHPALTPYDLGATRLRNRFVLTAHTTNFAVPGENLVTDRYISYLARRARGGVGMIVTEGIRVHPTTLRVSGLAGYQEGFEHGLERLATAVHDEGAALFGQVLHSGRHVSHPQLHAVSASDVPWTRTATAPHSMYRAELQDMLESYRSVSRRLASTSLDGLELHLGHGHLLQQFLSPLTNRRDDEYGGDLEGRLRFPREVLEATLESGAQVGIRISGDEFSPGGLGIEQMLEVLDRLVPHYPLAYVHVSHSVYDGGLSLSTQMADMSHDPEQFRRLSAAVKAQFPDLTVLTVCRVDSLDAADAIVREGQADLVGMARALIAEPDLVRKSAEGRTDEIRSCLYCNQGCAAHIEKNLPITCVVNPTVGYELTWPKVRTEEPAPATGVVVVGGGPAGMEAALAAAEGGHRVRLYEREHELGGAVRYASRLHGRERLGRLVSELAARVAQSPVEVVLGRSPSVADLIADDPDHVVVATGAAELPPELPGADEVLAPTQAMDRLDLGTLGDVVVLVDEDGSSPGTRLAHHIARTGRQVHLVIPSGQIAWNVTLYSRPPVVRDLQESGVQLHLMVRPVELRGDQIVLSHTVTGAGDAIDGVTDVVWAGCRYANDGLARELLDSSYRGLVHVVGDAYAPRSSLEATYDGRITGTLLGQDAGDGVPPHRPGLTARPVATP